MLVLVALRWFPVGFLIPVVVLLMIERGLTLGQVGLVASVQGLVVLLLELPTGGLADAIGRRPVLLVAAAVNLVSIVLLVVADRMWVFLVGLFLQGVFRALDSGPLDAWYVDAALAADPQVRYERGLGDAGVATGIAIAAGAMASSGVVTLHPVSAVSALTNPVLFAVGAQVLSLVAIAALMVEHRPARGLRALGASVREVPEVISGSVWMLRRSRVLLALIVVELLWGFGSVTFETLVPPRLAEVAGSATTAAAMLGPASSAAWIAAALGAAAIPLLTRWLRPQSAAVLLRLLQGATVVGMGLAVGVGGVLTAYVGCYVVHGASNPVHQGLLHRQVAGTNRTTVVSLNSMMGQSSGAAGQVVLTWLAGRAGVGAAMIVGAVGLAVAAPLYLVGGGRRAAATAGHPERPAVDVSLEPRSKISGSSS